MEITHKGYEVPTLLNTDPAHRLLFAGMDQLSVTKVKGVPVNLNHKSKEGACGYECLPYHIWHIGIPASSRVDTFFLLVVDTSY